MSFPHKQRVACGWGMLDHEKFCCKGLGGLTPSPRAVFFTKKTPGSYTIGLYTTQTNMGSMRAICSPLLQRWPHWEWCGLCGGYFFLSLCLIFNWNPHHRMLEPFCVVSRLKWFRDNSPGLYPSFPPLSLWNLKGVQGRTDLRLQLFFLPVRE